MVQEISGPDIIIQQKGALGHIILNRPSALNALNMDMIRGLTYALNDWEDDPGIKSILIEGAGDRAFCAGGDIKGFYNAGMDYRRGKLNFDVLMLFFKEEYELNKKLFHFKKPIISYMNGLTMGGGYGIAGNCRHRLVSENTIFAMPETKIGFFPDVGSMYHLTRANQGVGLFMAVFGINIVAGDMIRAGLADNFLPITKRPALIDMLVNMSAENTLKTVADFISECEFEAAPLPHSLDGVLEILNDGLKGTDNINDYISFLNVASRDNALIESYLKVLDFNSPISMAIAYAYYHRASKMTFDEIIEQDFILACNFAKGPDFYEGIRAAVIDKDKAPKWSNSELLGHGAKDLNAYFV
jgi:enoyl-CoA hydratase